MSIENLESLLSQMTENKMSEEDYLKIKEILEKYSINKNSNEQFIDSEFIGEEFETPENDWEDPTDFEFLNEESNGVVSQEENKEKSIDVKRTQTVLKIDENGQYQLPLEESSQMELDLVSNQMVEEKKEDKGLIENKSNESEKNQNEQTSTETQNNVEKPFDERKEPIFTLDGIEGVEANTALLHPVLPKTSPKFKNFEVMAQNAIGKFHNLFNFKDKNGKLDWYNAGKKTIIVLKNVKNMALDNMIINRFKKMIIKKYENSNFGIKTNQIANTITVNLMSREERYNKEFKNVMSLLGYNVKELIVSTNNPMLTLQEVSDNLNKNLKDNLGLELSNNGYSSDFIKGLTEDQKAQFIQTIVWPKLTEMMSESMKLFEALKDIKSKNPLCKEIDQIAKRNNMETDLFVTMLLKNPELLKQKNVKELESLMNKKEDIKNVFFKNEELFGKNFIVIQNLVKASSSIQKMILESNLSKEYKQKILVDMKNTVIKSDLNKKVLFESVQNSISSSLQDAEFVKSLREVNDSILKMRKNQTKETVNKPKV